jgi:hypothetical protein
VVAGVALGLAILAAFWNQNPQWTRDMESQPERWLQWAWAWSGGNNEHRVGHVPAYPWVQDGDDGLLDRLHVGIGDGEL